MTPRCKVCGSQTRLQHRSIILAKYDVGYIYCDYCGLLQTEEPYWLDEAYADVIALSDTGLVTRNFALALRLSSVLYFLFDRRGTYVDIGGGYGMLTRLMRDVGFDFHWSDPYCENLFARGFEADPARHHGCDGLTAFEVIEHVHDPLGFIRDHLARYGSSTLFFSTQLFDAVPPAPGEWPYYSQLTGQHVSFYQARTLHYIAKELSLSFYSSGYFHVMTDRKLSPLRFRAAASRASAVTVPLVRKVLGPLTLADRDRVLQAVSTAAVDAGERGMGESLGGPVFSSRKR